MLAASKPADMGTMSSVFQPLPFAEGIATFASNGTDCTTPQSDFFLGDWVCAKATGVPPSLFPWRILWAGPDGSIRQSDAASTDESTLYLYHIPGTQTSEVNGQTVDNRGTWKVNLARPNGAVRQTALFVVHEAANPVSDVFVQKFVHGDSTSVASGDNISFSLVVGNAGPDAALLVHLVDTVPAGATLVQITQNSGAPCLPVDSVDCTIASMQNGDRAEFTVIYNTGTMAPGEYQATATVTSSMQDPNNDNNNSFALFTVTASGGGTSCQLICPDNINANADTTEGGQRGTHVTFDDAVTAGDCGVVTATPGSGSFFPVGTTVVHESSETGNGACSFTVTVNDTGSNPPTISCPADKTANADGDCQASVIIGTPTTTGSNVTVVGVRSDGKPMYNCDCFPNSPNQTDDSCNIFGGCSRKNPDAPFSSGVTTITWQAISHDMAGPYTTPADEESHRTGTASCTQTITVNDTTPPVITATDSTVSADANCMAAIPDYSNAVTDNCSCAANDNSQDCVGQHRITTTQSPAAGTMVGLGPHTVHITANDGSSNPNPGPDGIFGTSDDGTGNITTKDVTFTVNDTTPPVITCPASQTVSTDPGTCSAVVNPGTATATDNCSSPTITGTRSDGQALNAPYPKGTTTITWTATDAAGNSSSCTQTITVQDHENPTIVCPAAIVQGNDPGTCSATVNPGQPTTHDNCDTPTVTGTRSDGQALNAPYPKGTTTITWTATDSSGNHSSCTQTVTVVDNEAPTFTFTGTQTMWPPNHKYRTFGTADLVASVHDNCDGTIPVSSVVITKVTSDEIENGNGDGNTLNDIVIAADCKSVQLRSEREGNSNGRVYTIFFSVTDAAGNVGTGTTKVVVPHNPGETAVDSGPHYTVTSNCP
jgi:uncharacterized repeat protein (TIGR01451 family)